MPAQKVWPLGSLLVRQTTSHPLPPAFEACLRVRPQPRAGFRTLPPCREPRVAQRYGTANEPPPTYTEPPLQTSKENTSRSLPARSKPTVEANKQPAEQKADVVKEQKKPEANTDKQLKPSGTPKDTKEAKPVIGSEVSKPQAAHAPVVKPTTPRPITASQSPRAELSPTPDQDKPTSSALGKVLEIGSPTAANGEDKPPHLQAPPYVHHFDTFTLVRALEENKSFSEDQAVTIMKAVRGMLADNLQLAREGIVSKGDEEMESYLFRAACSELRTEIKNNRSSVTERMRTERTMLQHEVDILAQRITGDTGNLKDELKGMFDDRKMGARMERRDIENKIQELNYHITSRLNSEMRSDVEGLRWVLVRRTAIALGVVAGTALIVIRLNSSKQKRNKDDGEASGRRRVERSGGQEGARADEFQGGGSGEIRGTDLLKGLENGGDPSLVSLG